MSAMTATRSPPNDKTWGLDRLDGALDSHYGPWLGGATGRGVRAYVIDSGIQATHREFADADSSAPPRVTCGKNFRANLGEDCGDEWGHGTHAAALIGASYVLVSTRC